MKLFYRKHYTFLFWVISLVLSLPFFFGGPFDSEDFRYSFLSAKLFWNNIFAGNLPFWSPKIGFGVNLPLAQPLDFHPLSFLLNFLSVQKFIFIFVFFHFVVAIHFLRKIFKEFKFSPELTGLGTFTYITTPSVVGCMYMNFWPTAFAEYLMTPGLIYSAMKIEKKLSIYTLLFGFFIGNFLSWVHLGTVICIFIFIALYIIVNKGYELKEYFWQYVLGVFIGVCIGSNTVVNIYMELLKFDQTLFHFKPNPFTLFEIIRNLILSPEIPLFDNVTLDRKPFYGTVFFIISCIMLFTKTNKFMDKFKVLYVLIFLLMISKLELTFSAISTSVIFRDSLYFVGIILCLNYFKSFKFKNTIFYTLISLHVMQMIFTFYPHWSDILKNSPDESYLKASKLQKEMIKFVNSGDRILLSPELDKGINENGTFEYADTIGTWAINSNLTLINGIYKGVAQGSWVPDLSRMYGQIRSNQYLIDHIDILNFYHVDYVLSERMERVSSELILVKSDIFHQGRQIFDLYKNPNMDKNIIYTSNDIEFLKNTRIPPVPSCGHEKFLCLNIHNVFGKIYPVKGTRVDFKDGSIEISSSHYLPKNILIPVRYESGWISSGNTMAFSAFKDMLGVQIIGNENKIVLKFRPLYKLAAFLISLISMLIVLSGIVFYLLKSKYKQLNFPRIRPIYSRS